MGSDESRIHRLNTYWPLLALYDICPRNWLRRNVLKFYDWGFNPKVWILSCCLIFDATTKIQESIKFTNSLGSFYLLIWGQCVICIRLSCSKTSWNCNVKSPVFHCTWFQERMLYWDSELTWTSSWISSRVACHMHCLTRHEIGSAPSNKALFKRAISWIDENKQVFVLSSIHDVHLE